MKHGLMRGEPRNRRQHAKSISGQEHHVLGMSRQSRDHGVIDEIHRIGGAGIFGFAAVIVVGNASVRIEDDVFQHASKAQRIPDLRLVLVREFDALGVASALEVENSIGAPAVFIVADQSPGRIRGKRGLAGSGETEEKCAYAVVAHIGRAVHGKYIAGREQEVHHAENGFLHFSRVGRAPNQHGSAGEVERNENLRIDAVALGVRLELGCANNSEFGMMCLHFLRRRPYKKLVHEQVVPRIFVDDPHRQAIFRIGPAEKILDEELAAAQVLHHTLVERVELFRLHGRVHRAPGYAVGGNRILHNELVFGRAPCAVGKTHQRAVGGQFSFVAANRVLYQVGRRKIEMGSAVAEQLRDITDVHCGRHEISFENSKKGKPRIVPQR